ncbi:MAG: response regulator transcription factor [Defluviitaleaceae bacterium]|nr:response regulator transcription factor [Defluviitaleaceae bacterium]
MKKKIFVVEDDAALQELYSYSLESEFECTCFGDATSFFCALEKNRPDLVLLDIMLPGSDGFEILSRLKAQFPSFPVIMVSARGDEVSKVKGLNMGADDYISKPFGVLELVARIKANLRKNPPAAKTSIFKDIEIDIEKHVASANGRAFQTTLKEFNLLVFLCNNAEKLQERETIFKNVWGENFFGETRTLDIHVKELRKKLRESGSVTEIKTVRGVGYMLV